MHKNIEKHNVNQIPKHISAIDIILNDEYNDSENLIFDYSSKHGDFIIKNGIWKKSTARIAYAKLENVVIHNAKYNKCILVDSVMIGMHNSDYSDISNCIVHCLEHQRLYYGKNGIVDKSIIFQSNSIAHFKSFDNIILRLHYDKNATFNGNNIVYNITSMIEMEMYYINKNIINIEY